MTLLSWVRGHAVDVMLSVVSLVLGTLMLVAANQLPEVATFRDVGPTYFPEIIGWGFLVTAVLMLVAARRPSTPAAPVAVAWTEGTDEEEVPPPRLDRPWSRFLLAVSVTVSYTYLLPRLGFLSMTVPFMFLLGLVFGSRRVLVNGATAVVATGLLYLVFRVWLRVPLPS